LAVDPEQKERVLLPFIRKVAVAGVALAALAACSSPAHAKPEWADATTDPTRAAPRR
jgi:hypothetical protein